MQSKTRLIANIRLIAKLGKTVSCTGVTLTVHTGTKAAWPTVTLGGTFDLHQLQSAVTDVTIIDHCVK